MYALYRSLGSARTGNHRVRRIPGQRYSAPIIIPFHGGRPLLPGVDWHDFSLCNFQQGSAEGIAILRGEGPVEVHSRLRILQVLCMWRSPPSYIILEQPCRWIFWIGDIKG